MSIESKIREAFERHADDPQPTPGAWPLIEKRIHRTRRRRMFAATVGAAAAITGMAVFAPNIVGNEQELIEPGPSSSPAPVTKIAVPGFALAADRDSIWTLVRSDNERAPDRLVRIDPRTNEETASIETGVETNAVATGEGAVWVANGNGCSIEPGCGEPPGPEFDFPQVHSVMRIDPSTNTVVASIGVTSPDDLVTGFGSVWVSSSQGAPWREFGPTVLRIDPATNQVSAIIQLERGPGFGSHLTVGAGSVWVTTIKQRSTEQGMSDVALVQRIDPRTSTVVDTIEVPARGSTAPPLVFGDAAVWVATPGEDSPSGLARIDPVVGRVVATVELPDAAPVGLEDVAAGGGYVWASSGRGYLWKVDPATNAAVGDPILVGDAPPVSANSVLYTFGSTWVTSGDGKIWRVAA